MPRHVFLLNNKTRQDSLISACVYQKSVFILAENLRSVRSVGKSSPVLTCRPFLNRATLMKMLIHKMQPRQIIFPAS